jgi:hypothetical protein
MMNDTKKTLARLIADEFSQISSVEAITIGGAQLTHPWGSHADVELFIYARNAQVDTVARERLIKARAEHYEIGRLDGEITDQWLERMDDTHVRVVYRGVGWIIDEIQRIMTYHEARVGNSTTLLYNVRHAEPIFDRGNWFAELLKTTNQPYPTALAEAIIAENYPILRTTFSSYTHQIERNLALGDLLGVQTVLSALFAGVFEVLFAANRVPNPGYPHWIDAAEATCDNRPANLRADVDAVLNASPDELVSRIHHLLNEIDVVLKAAEALS